MLSGLLEELDIQSPLAGGLTHGVTAHSRTDGENTYLFLENYSPTETAQVTLRGQMLDLLTGEPTGKCTLKPYGFGIFKTL